jgi:DNA-binding LytR/AlgR family response regulator
MHKTITYILADDDPLYREVTLQQLQLIPDLNCLAVCESAIEAKTQLEEQFPDLLILDVEMPGLTGIQLAKSLTRLPLIIFISSHATYAADAFDVDAIAYLVKPAPPEKLLRAIDKAKMLVEMKSAIAANEGFKTAPDNSFFIKDKNAFIKVHYADVLYIESLGDFINIFLQNGEKKIALVSMKNVEQQLPSTSFVRISRTHIVNKEKVTAVDNGNIYLNKLQLHIGKTYTDSVMQAVIGNAAIKRFL